MIESNISRAKRRAFVKFYKERVKIGGCHFICLAAKVYDDFLVTTDVLRCVKHTLGKSAANTIPTAFNILHCEEKRQQMRNKWLRVYAEQGVAYNWKETNSS